MKYEKLKPLLKSYILKTGLENYNTRSKNSKKLQSCTTRHFLKSCNRAVLKLASLERRTWEGKLFHNLE